MMRTEGRLRHLDLLRKVRTTAADSMPPEVAAAMEQAAKVRNPAEFVPAAFQLNDAKPAPCAA